MTATAPRPVWRDWVGLVARLVLGGALLYAGAQKLVDLQSSVTSVRAYQLLPDWLAQIVGFAMPVIEVCLGLLLIIGLFTRVAAAVGTLMMVAFIIAIASVWARGISIDCGCFSPGGPTAEFSPVTYALEILRDLAFAACGAWLILRPRTPFAVDNWLFGRPAAIVDDEEIDA